MNYKEIDSLLHSPLRLIIISQLVATSQCEFTALKNITGATAGNLSIQIKKLKQVGYISVTKGYKQSYPHTTVEITQKGIQAFEEYVHTLKKIINK